MGQKEINQVSEMLNVKPFEIQNMESRLSGGDVFLNQKIDNDSENDLMSLLEDERANPEESFENFNDGKIERFSRHRVPKRYIELAGHSDVIAHKKILDSDDISLEFMMNTLRLTNGISANLFFERTGLIFFGME